ncbi:MULTISPECIES: DUF4845 domain-containing protein [Methylobacillus]|uniref:Putative transmembrane protein n=1 Tax=Methylobacillus flagellatus (strain ATCC 51484 / DSM 6875 / VKM B-1610 / KT) TaxID=265072 RepID=Q1H2L3_METFK|nr:MULTISPECIES: DUF4845 domain-containing protein [Methylobacillus]ABE49130.1 putative transmembrane protein [Methylobacillus flagellatus KT]ABE49274.1 putative transmembrane protein [Methylobacillus flagellatus KT]MPS49776.1 DUF4845 domain-containing protein [Methylobacillus sp.]
MKKQQGMSFLSLVVVIAVGIFFAVLAMKLAPSYIEYFAVKKAISRIAHDPGFSSMSKADMIAAFQKSATIDDIRSVEARDLTFLRDENGKTALSVDYQVVVPLFSNISVLLDFEASTDNAR